MKEFLFRCRKLIFGLLIGVSILIWAIVDSGTIESILSKSFSISILSVLWVIFAVEIVCRIVPTKDIGISKMYKRHFAPVDEHTEALHTLVAKDSKRCILMVILYLCVLCTIGVVYALHIIDRVGILLLVLLFWILSEVCVQIFCPFSYLFLGRVCCNKCRIYSWDYLMILAPLIYIFSVESIVLVLLSIALVVVWEVLYQNHPYRYYDYTNKNLKCEHCTNKNCLYKAKINNFADKILHKNPKN